LVINDLARWTNHGMDVTALLQPNLRPTISQLDLEQSGKAFVLHEQQMEI